MCLIATSNDKNKIPLALLENAYENNKDGVGIVYLNKATNRLEITKSHGNFDDFKKIWEDVPAEVNVAVHFRFKTHGEISVDNIHPYEILSKDKGHGIDLVIMHNGTIGSIHQSGDKRSDTAMYVDLILRPILAENPSLILNEGFMRLVARDIGHHNKFVFFDSLDNVIILNKDSGHERKEVPDVWFSNSYSIATSTYRSSKTSAPSYSYFGRNSINDDFSGYWGSHFRKNVPEITERTVGAEDNFAYVSLDQVYPNSVVERLQIQKINRYLNDDEKLLSKTNKSGKKSIGYGWVMKGGKTYTYYPNIADMHEELDKIRKEIAKEEAKRSKKKEDLAPTIMMPPDAQLTMSLSNNITLRDLAVYNSSEILEWVMSNPMRAAEMLIDKGFGGGKISVEAYVQSNIDHCVELIYNLSHFGSFNAPYGNQFEYPTDIAI